MISADNSEATLSSLELVSGTEPGWNSMVARRLISSLSEFVVSCKAESRSWRESKVADDDAIFYIPKRGVVGCYRVVCCGGESYPPPPLLLFKLVNLDLLL